MLFIESGRYDSLASVGEGPVLLYSLHLVRYDSDMQADALSLCIHRKFSCLSYYSLGTTGVNDVHPSRFIDQAHMTPVQNTRALPSSQLARDDANTLCHSAQPRKLSL